MPTPTRGRLPLIAGIVVLLIVVILAAVWWTTRGGDSAPAPVSTASAPTAARPAAPSQVAIPADAESFAVLGCQARLFEDSPALAVTFSQPLDTKQALDRVMRVVDYGKPDDNASPTGEPKPGTALGGSARNGNWVIGSNPRVAYFPFITPERRYGITIDRGVKPQQGAALPDASHCEVASDAMPPSYYFASRGVVLPAGQNGGLPVVTVNMPEVDVQFLRVGTEQMPTFFEKVLGVRPAAPARKDDEEGEEESDDEYYYGSESRMQGNTSTWELDRLKDLATSVHIGRYRTDDKPNRRHVSFLPVESIAELKEPGIYVAVMSQPGRFRSEYQVTYFYVSDLGMHVRRYGDRIDAFVSSLSSGKAVGGVDLTLLDEAAKPVARASVDKQGHASFTGKLDSARLLLAQRGKEMSVIALHEPALDLSEFDIQGLPARTNRLFVYAGRDLYRPGERFEVSVLARDADGRAVAATPLAATLKRPDGRVVSRDTWAGAADAGGYRKQALALPVDAQTGTWTLELRVDPGARVADASWTFQVEEFLPERMKLSIDAGDAVLEPGAPLQLAVQGDYLYGAPAAGNRLLGNFSVARQRVPLPQQWPGFIFGDIADDSRRMRQELSETELDEGGAAAMEVPIEVGGAHSVMRARVTLSLLESGGRPVVRSVERDVWPAQALIGVRPNFTGDVVREGGLAEFEIVRADAAGEFAPLSQATLRLYREERRYYWRYDDQRGWHSGFTETEELVDARTLALKERTKVALPVQYGRYRLEIADPDTHQALRYRFYAGWDAQDAEALGNRPDRVQLRVADSPVRGDKPLALTVTPPHDGEAIISVEGDRLLWTTRAQVKAAGTQIEIPFDPAWQRHDLYVSVVVFRPGAQAESRITPARAVGLLYLPLARDERTLKVALDAPAKVRPERVSTVGVQVTGAGEAKQAWVTLSAVDVGILSITNFATPDPVNFFFGKQRYSPDMLDMYGKLIEKMDGTVAQPRWGGDANQRDSRSMPTKVRLVDLFSGPVALDAQGRAQIPLNIPDFNGTLRLMAVAYTDDRFGKADAEMTVAAPIVAELSTPRFISQGDEATIALDVTNLSGARQDITVVLEADAPLHIGDETRQLKLNDRQRNTLRFKVTADAPIGDGLLRLRVRGRGGPEPIDITRESLLGVNPLWPATRNAYRTRIGPGETWQPDAGWMAALYPAGATVSVTASNRPPFNVARLVQGLLDYPYGCTEQTLSAAYPWVFIDDAAAKEFGLTPRPFAERAQRVAQAVSRLSGMLKSPGGYTLWGDGALDTWLSAYALGFMQDARNAGFPIPEDSAKQTQTWLLTQLQAAGGHFPSLPATMARGANGRYRSADAELLRNSHRRFADLAFAAYVLSRDKQAPLSTLRLLADQYADRAQSPLPLVHLALALQQMGDAQRATAMLDRAMTRQYGIDGDTWLGDYGSAIRDLAMSYALMSEAKLTHPRRELLLTDIASRLEGRRYLSTQEQLALLRAARAAGGGGGTWQAHWEEGGARTQAWQGGPAQNRYLDIDRLADTRLVNDGSEPLFVEAEVQGFPRQPDLRQTDGLSIRRTWFRPDGRQWTGGALTAGDTLVVRLEVNSRMRLDDAMVVDRVPAGLEVENVNLLGTSQEAWMVGGVNVREVMSDPAIRHTEYRDDRFVAAARLGTGKTDFFYSVRVVTPGRYKAPPPLIEDMYRPDIRALGAPGNDIRVDDPRAPTAP